jgi:hypothetical protein
MEERASKYCEDIYRFDGDAHTFYEGSGTVVTKYEAWRNRSATVTIQTAKCHRATTPTDGGRVSDRFEGLKSSGVRKETGTEEIGVATEERLKNLGYM